MTNETPEISWNELVKFFPKQKEALDASKKFKFLLYGGSVGAGKSYWLRWTALYWLMRYYDKLGLTGVRVGLFCEDYPALNDRHLSKIRVEFPDWLGKYNDKYHEFTLEPEYGSGVLAFRNLDDPSRYLSVEFALEAVDEINRNEKQTFDMLRTRLRWPGIKDTKFIAACNPVGEAWVKNYWVKRSFPIEEKERQEFFFVNALPTDNPHLPQEYFESLKSLPEAERKAYLEGDWDSFDTYTDQRGFIRLLTDAEISNALVAKVSHAGKKVLWVDPGAGGDESAIGVRSEIATEVLYNQKLADTMALVPIITGFLEEWDIKTVVMDNVGIGRGIYDRLRQLKVDVVGVNFGATPVSGKYVNKKAELYWKARQWLLGGAKLKRHEAFNQLEIVKYKVLTGKIEIESKKSLVGRGVASPNVADGLAISMAVDPSAGDFESLYHSRPKTDRMVEIWNGK